jgi:hypothetical protein
MERDYRRGPGQWKGCHLFRDIICNGDLSKTRHGALQMGHTYYYYVRSLLLYQALIITSRLPL